jgi:hypothetical protein
MDVSTFKSLGLSTKYFSKIAPIDFFPNIKYYTLCVVYLTNTPLIKDSLLTMTILKRTRKSSVSDLIKAIDKLAPLLLDQGETEAAECLQNAAENLQLNLENQPGQKDAIRQIVEAFEGEHELMAYTLQRGGDQWTEVEKLSQASSRVISLAKRVAQGL